MEHKEYISRLPIEKRFDLAKLTYECLVSAQNERAKLMIVMNLMQNEASKRFQFSEQLGANDGRYDANDCSRK